MNVHVHMLIDESLLVSFSLVLGGGGGTPLYGLYRYVPRNRVWFLEVFDP